MTLRVLWNGSLYLAHPQDRDAARWLRETAAGDAQWWGGALVVEDQHIVPFLDVAIAAGMEIAP